MENILNEILKDVKTIKADVSELKQRQSRLEKGQQENTESIQCILEITSTIERVTQSWNDENNRKIEALSRNISSLLK